MSGNGTTRHQTTKVHPLNPLRRTYPLPKPILNNSCNSSKLHQKKLLHAKVVTVQSRAKDQNVQAISRPLTNDLINTIFISTASLVMECQHRWKRPKILTLWTISSTRNHFWKKWPKRVSMSQAWKPFLVCFTQTTQEEVWKMTKFNT